MKVLNQNWSGVKVLVTGASGFKGAWLCAALLELGADVFGTVRNRKEPHSAYNILNLGAKIVEDKTDLTQYHQVSQMINTIKPDIIFHLAAKAQVPVARRDPRTAYNVNVMGTLNVLEACRILEIVDKLIICSTDHVFGNIANGAFPKGGFPENHNVGYGGPYDTSKAAMELMVRSQHLSFGDKLPSIIITRASNVFGYGDVNQRRVIPHFILSALKGKKIWLDYRHNGRQFIHITDIVAGYIRAASVNIGARTPPHQLTSGREPAQQALYTPTFHFGMTNTANPDKPYLEIGQLAQMIASIFSAKIEEAKNCVVFAPGENRVQGLNCLNTQATLSWKTHKSIRQGIEELSHWYLKQDRNIDYLKRLMDKDIEHIINILQDAPPPNNKEVLVESDNRTKS